MDSSYSFQAMTFFFSGIIGYLYTNTILEQISYLGPRFRARPQKGPKIEKNGLLLKLLSQDLHFFRDYWLPMNKQNQGTDFFIWGPVLGPGPKGPPKNGFLLQFLSQDLHFFQGLLVTHEPTISWNGFLIWGPDLGLGPKGPQN